MKQYRRLATVAFVAMMAAWCPLRAQHLRSLPSSSPPSTSPRSVSPASLASASTSAPASPQIMRSHSSPSEVERLEVAFGRFDVLDTADRRWTARTLRGRVVLLDFWATWCAPCLVELPALKRLQARHAGEPFTLIGVNIDAMDRRTLAGWLRRQDVSWPQIHERRAYDSDLARAFEVAALPRTVLLDGEGRVIATNLRGDALARAVADALGVIGPR